MDPEMKALLEAQTKTFEEFKAANDKMQAEVAKLGQADTLTAEKVEKLGRALDEQAEQMKKARAHADEVEAKLNRIGIGHNGGPALEAEQKAAAEFSRLTGQEISLDDFRGYKGAMDVYLRKGDKGHQAEIKALSVGSDPDGGYMVTPDVTGRVVKKIYETTPIRQVASVVTIGTDALEGPIDNGEADAGWVGEIGSRSETGTPQLGKWSIPVNEVYAQPKATLKLLEDASVDMESWLINKVANKIARVENAAFIAGDGVQKPKGLLAYAMAATSDKAGRPWGSFEYLATGVNGNFAASNPADKLFDLVYALKNGYRQNARFLMTRATVGAIRKLKDGQGRYLWDPGLNGGQGQSILGYPLVEGEDMPEISSNGYSIGFGDFAETYQIVDRVGISVLRDPFTQKGWIVFFVRRRTGGGAVNFESMKFLKFATS